MKVSIEEKIDWLIIGFFINFVAFPILVKKELYMRMQSSTERWYRLNVLTNYIVYGSILQIVAIIITLNSIL